MNRPARNQPCPCGSGRKYKQCCGKTDAPRVSRPPSLNVPLAVSKPSPVAARRPCAGCTACCTTLIINDANLVVPPGTACPHECAAGCAIHGARQPESCRTYFCGYTLDPAELSERDRPDRVGAIVDCKQNRGKPAPMHRTTHVVACAPDGLRRVLENAHWRSVIRRDLLAGIPILAAQHDDPLNREVLGVRWHDNRLLCRLTSCNPDGSPMLTTLEPVHDPPVHIALLIPEQGFPFETEALVNVLGKRSFLVVRSSSKTAEGEPLGFLFTQRQAEWVRRLHDQCRERAGQPGSSGHSVGRHSADVAVVSVSG